MEALTKYWPWAVRIGFGVLVLWLIYEYAGAVLEAAAMLPGV